MTEREEIVAEGNEREIAKEKPCAREREREREREKGQGETK